MLSLTTARALHAAGLPWRPAEFDFFAIPDRDLDDRIFVINRMPAGQALLHGQPVFTFDGAAEWALDYIAAGEVIWVPTEAQLRALLAERLDTGDGPALSLHVQAQVCLCEIRNRGETLTFEAPNGAEAYAAALLHLLQTSRTAS
jgi:hypothetical protein